MKPKVLLATIGSLGDLYPFIAVGKALLERGLAPVLATSPMYRSRVEAEGIGFVPVRPDEADITARLGMSMPELVSRLARDDGFLLRGVLLPFLGAGYADILPAIEGAAMVIAHPLAEPAKLAAEKLGIPQISLFPVPALLMSAYDPPRIGPVRLISMPQSRVALACNRTALKVLRIATGAYVRKFQAFRREIGLEQSSSVGFLESPQARASIGLFSPLLARDQPDYPPHTSIVGFPFFDGTEGASLLTPELERFLAEGPAPIVITLGSIAVLDGTKFFRASIEAVRRLGRRAIIIARDSDREGLCARDAPDILVCGYVPYSRVFRHAAAIIHHGGIGTSAQALRAGKPQLVVPFFGDQHDNVRRLVRLGLARHISRRRYTADRAAAELAVLLNNPDCARRAADLSGLVDREDGPTAAAQIIHAMLRDDSVLKAGSSAAA